jgi:hypothetical protein
LSKPVSTKNAVKKAAKAARKKQEASSPPQQSNSLNPTLTNESVGKESQSHLQDEEPEELNTSSAMTAPVGSQHNPLAVPDEGLSQEPSDLDLKDLIDGSALEPSDKEPPRESGSGNMHSIDVIGPDGRRHDGNIEVKISSSEQTIPALPQTKPEAVIHTLNTPKTSNVVKRTLTTFMMIGGFIGE